MNELPDVLRQIVARRRQRVSQGYGAPESVHDRAGQPAAGAAGRFISALRTAEGRSIIAEVKLGSPRLGSIESSVDPESQARMYADFGAAALSVVVEPDFFYGSYDLLRRCREASGLVVLAKDFVVDPVQLEWASCVGADAVLLIAAMLSRAELTGYAERARELDLDVLVECHSREDVAALDGGGWQLVGINNRNLRTFEVDLGHSLELLRYLPREACKIAESGISSAADVESLSAAGFDAFLVGESLLTAPDPGAKLSELVGARGVE